MRVEHFSLRPVVLETQRRAHVEWRCGSAAFSVVEPGDRDHCLNVDAFSGKVGGGAHAALRAVRFLQLHVHLDVYWHVLFMASL